ncbi:MAG TPA: ABC transporter ATP-binding protein [Stellaceae bacterium]|nr:ABC transporter ATP-binding protein [Stellaceae bacterium]
MINLSGVSKVYKTETGTYHKVLSDVSFDIAPGEKIAVIGRNGAGKSTLVRLIAGMELPSSGTIRRSMSVSWPVGLNGALANGMTGNDNIRMICRLYGKPFRETQAMVDDFAQLGKWMSEPMTTFSAGMRARLNFALSLAVDFDCYLVDEIIAVGDQRFQRRCQEELFEKRADRSLVLASHIPDHIRHYCSRAVIVHRGRAKEFDDLELAIEIYNDL